MANLTIYSLNTFKDRLRYLIQKHPAAYQIAAIIRHSRNGSVEDQIEDVFWAFASRDGRELLELLAEPPDSDTDSED